MLRRLSVLQASCRCCRPMPLAKWLRNGRLVPTGGHRFLKFNHRPWCGSSDFAECIPLGGRASFKISRSHTFCAHGKLAPSSVSTGELPASMFSRVDQGEGNGASRWCRNSHRDSNLWYVRNTATRNKCAKRPQHSDETGWRDLARRRLFRAHSRKAFFFLVGD